MGQVGIRLANVAIFVLTCSLVANVVNQVAGAMLIPDRPDTLATREAPAARARPWEERQAILDRNLFDAQVASIELPPEPEPEEQLQETRLPLKLLGTIASHDPVAASAAIEDEKTRKHEVVKVGDALSTHSGVTVLRIERGRVVLQNGARREELTLDEDITFAAAPVSRVTPKRRAANRRSRAARAPSVRNRLESLAEEGGDRSPAAIFSQARILPKYENGEMVGIQLSKIEADSFYERVGLQDGDVVKELNGIQINSPSASKELLEAFARAEELKATVIGPDGTERQISADAAAMGELSGLLR